MFYYILPTYSMILYNTMGMSHLTVMIASVDRRLQVI